MAGIAVDDHGEDAEHPGSMARGKASRRDPRIAAGLKPRIRELPLGEYRRALAREGGPKRHIEYLGGRLGRFRVPVRPDPMALSLVGLDLTQAQTRSKSSK